VPLVLKKNLDPLITMGSMAAFADVNSAAVAAASVKAFMLLSPGKRQETRSRWAGSLEILAEAAKAWCQVCLIRVPKVGKLRGSKHGCKRAKE
jgi:hypothetical protein